MKKRIYTIFLIFLFSLSTIGLPLTINLCSMMGSKGMESCEMGKMNCDNQDQPIYNKAVEKEGCCKSTLIDKSISDQYLKIETQKESINQNLFLLKIGIENSYNEQSFASNYLIDSSPPPLISNNLYIHNSVLLI